MDAMRRILSATGISLLLLATNAMAQERDWPSRPIRFVVPFAAGSTADVRARQVA